MTDNITLNDQERAALEALWRAGGTLDFDRACKIARALSANKGE